MDRVNRIITGEEYQRTVKLMAVQCFLYRLFDPEQELEKMGCEAGAARAFIPEIGPLTVKWRGLAGPEAGLLADAAARAGAAVLPVPYQGSPSLLTSGTGGAMKRLAERITGLPGLEAAGTDLDTIARHAYRRPSGFLQAGSRLLPLGERTLIMGILNVTPDSFSDGGRFHSVEAAVARALRMVSDGADIIDIGGESTRPGHRPVPEEEELSRVLPVIRALAGTPGFDTPISIDTTKSRVAEESLAAGATMINDVWGFKKDPGLAGVTARAGVPVCLMHNRENTFYDDLLPDIMAEIRECVSIALNAGVKPGQILVDPGIGFGKNLPQNLEVMRRLEDLTGLGYPLLLGTSRKSLIGKTLDLPVEDRLEGTAATVAWGIAAGAGIIRVHDVREMARVTRMTDAMMRR